jgi:hypothetical protein
MAFGLIESHQPFGFQHTWPPIRIGVTDRPHFAISQSTYQLSVGEVVDWTGDDWPKASSCDHRDIPAAWGLVARGLRLIEGTVTAG